MPRSDKMELSEDDIKKLESMAGLGLTVANMAAILGMSKKTLERRMAEDESIRDALERGRGITSNNVAKSAYKQAMSGNTAMTIFWLKTRMGWKETERHEVKQTINLNYNLDDEE